MKNLQEMISEIETQILLSCPPLTLTKIQFTASAYGLSDTKYYKLLCNYIDGIETEIS